jgi:hypothetical protein
MHLVESKSDKIIDLSIIFGQKAQGISCAFLMLFPTHFPIHLDKSSHLCYNRINQNEQRRLL